MIRIRQAALDAIVGHTRSEAPLECCGLLIGTPELIERAMRARNARASPTRYLVDPGDHFVAIKEARAESLDVVGAYHSHPASPPVPSETDRAEAYTDFCYLIASLRGGDDRPEVRAYLLRDGEFEALELVAVP